MHKKTGRRKSFIFFCEFFFLFKKTSDDETRHLLFHRLLMPGVHSCFGGCFFAVFFVARRRECTQNTSLIVFAFVTRLSIKVLHTYYISH